MLGGRRFCRVEQQHPRELSRSFALPDHAARGARVFATSPRAAMWAAARTRLQSRVIPIMSYPHFSSAFNHREFIPELSASQNSVRSSKSAHSNDRAIDSALRSVPLPEGLMTRLSKLVYTIADERSDQVDCLGC